jgi:hypothetical protein
MRHVRAAQCTSTSTCSISLFRVPWVAHRHFSQTAVSLVSDPDLEWKVIYVGSSESSDYDQTLEEVLVGPVTAGCHKFILQADAPDPTKLLELLGVTVVLIACSYQNHEFVRIGYYVNNELQQQQQQQEYDDDHGDHDDIAMMSMMESELTHPYASSESQPQGIVSPLLRTTTNDLSQVIRTILADKPRVTRFAIPWHSHYQQSQDPYELTRHMTDAEDPSLNDTEEAFDETMTTTTPEPILFDASTTTTTSPTDNAMTLDPAGNGTWMARIVSPTNHHDDMDF